MNTGRVPPSVVVGMMLSSESTAVRLTALELRRRVHQQRVADVGRAREVDQEPAPVPVGRPRVRLVTHRLAVDAAVDRRLAPLEPSHGQSR